MDDTEQQVRELVQEATTRAARNDTLPSVELLGLNEFSFLPFDENGNPDYGDGLCIGWAYFADTKSEAWPAHRARCGKWLNPDLLAILDGKVKQARFVAVAHNASLELKRGVYFGSGRDLPAFAVKAAKLVETLDGFGASHVFATYVGDERFAKALDGMLAGSRPRALAPPRPAAAP